MLTYNHSNKIIGLPGVISLRVSFQVLFSRAGAFETSTIYVKSNLLICQMGIIFLCLI